MAEQSPTDPAPAADTSLQWFDEDWHTALAVVAHPDDMEYGAASAVARWTQQGKEVAYLLVTRGEAGIATQPPHTVGPLREQEQRDSCAVVGVTDIEFLDHTDGLVEASVELRRDIANSIRRVRPEVLVSINFRDSWGPPSWNHVDHRNVGIALLDAARDAANPWLFGRPDAAWDGVRFAAFGGSPQATHAVDVTGFLDHGIESLRRHAVYLANLGGNMAEPDDFLRSFARDAGARMGVEYATTFEVIPL